MSKQMSLSLQRLLALLLEGLAAMQAAVPGGHLLPLPATGGHPAPPPVKTPTDPEREPSWTATR